MVGKLKAMVKATTVIQLQSGRQSPVLPGITGQRPSQVLVVKILGTEASPASAYCHQEARRAGGADLVPGAE